MLSILFMTSQLSAAAARSAQPPRAGPPRVLIVEDSFMTARTLKRMVEDCGGVVLGPVPSVERAMALLDAHGCDGAVLDINLGNETVEAVAERLHETGRPFFFVSGYSSPKSMLTDPRFRARTLLAKPVDPRLFERTMAQELGPPRA
jgi:CheY-like chemotaxis protein